MLSPYDFLSHAHKLPSGTSTRMTLLRIGLNARFDPHRYPVDLIEVVALPPTERALAFAFLSWCAAYPEDYTSTPSWALEDLCQEVDDSLLQKRNTHDGA